jgi:hypothetical protein
MGNPHDPNRPVSLSANAAKRAKRQVRQRERTPFIQRLREPESRRSALAYGRACMTPVGGIPPATGSGVNPGSAVCEMWDFDGNATPPKWVDSGKTELTFNQSGSAAGVGGKLVLVEYFQGYPFVTVDPC